MYFNCHYSFPTPKADALHTVLKGIYGVNSEITFSWDRETMWITFVLADSHPQFDEIHQLMSNGQWGIEDPIDLEPTVCVPVFTEEEYASAQWLMIRSSLSKVFPVNEKEVFAYNCIVGLNKYGVVYGRHREGKGVCVVDKAFKWGRHHIASSSFAEGFLFCDDIARQVFEKNGLNGIKYQPVLTQKTGKAMENIHQFAPIYQLEDAAIVGRQFTKTATCDQCGMKMILFENDRFRYAIRREFIPADIDFCKTPAIFCPTWLDDISGGFSESLISQKMYRIIKEYALDRSLWFEPIEVI